MPDTSDVIIIGSGAGGGTLAPRLAPSGRNVLVLERGDWLPREAENWDAQAVHALTAIANAPRVGDHISERLA
jgi:choline dehydrogenase-like flavoprotein